MTANIEGFTTVRSPFGPKETLDRLEAAIASQGMKVFARINHGALAAEVGLELRPTEVVLFGNPRGGTPLMQTAQTIGIDLPLKALVWQDAAALTWLSYLEPGWLARRHGIQGAGHLIDAMGLAMAALAVKATSNPAP